VANLNSLGLSLVVAIEQQQNYEMSWSKNADFDVTLLFDIILLEVISHINSYNLIQIQKDDETTNYDDDWNLCLLSELGVPY
jgi:hypothetical protein